MDKRLLRFVFWVFVLGVCPFFSVSVYVLFFEKKRKNRKRFCRGSLLGLVACGNLLCGVLEVCGVQFFARREFGWWG